MCGIYESLFTFISHSQFFNLPEFCSPFVWFPICPDLYQPNSITKILYKLCFIYSSPGRSPCHPAATVIMKRRFAASQMDLANKRTPQLLPERNFSRERAREVLCKSFHERKTTSRHCPEGKNEFYFIHIYIHKSIGCAAILI